MAKTQAHSLFGIAAADTDTGFTLHSYDHLQAASGSPRLFFWREPINNERGPTGGHIELSADQNAALTAAVLEEQGTFPDHPAFQRTLETGATKDKWPRALPGFLMAQHGLRLFAAVLARFPEGIGLAEGATFQDVLDGVALAYATHSEDTATDGGQLSIVSGQGPFPSSVAGIGGTTHPDRGCVLIPSAPWPHAPGSAPLAIRLVTAVIDAFAPICAAPVPLLGHEQTVHLRRTFRLPGTARSAHERAGAQRAFAAWLEAQPDSRRTAIATVLR